MKRVLLVAGLSWILCVAAVAQDVVTISSCPTQPALPVPVQVDCSHVADAATKQLCRPFAENQACKVFWAYRDITGINLEGSCHVFKYTVYDKGKWPHPAGEGGLAQNCGADYIADVSLLIKSQIGPYDVHEMLHVYQDELGSIPNAHILFGPAMTEARRRIGDNKGYWDAMTRLKGDVKRIEAEFEEKKIRPDQECYLAEVYTETSLYLKDPKNVEQFYRKLGRSWEKDIADRQRRFNRMYNEVSGGTAKPFLLSHCPAF